MVIVVMVIITVVRLSVRDRVIVIVVGLFLFAVTRRGGRYTRRLVIGALLIGFLYVNFSNPA